MEFEKTKKDVMSDHILLQSSRIFIQYGFVGTSMDMIAKSCDITKPTLYRYFRSKEELFEEIYNRLYRDMVDHIFTLLKNSAKKLQAFEEIIDFLFDFGESHRPFFYMFWKEHHLIVRHNIDEHIKHHTQMMSGVKEQMMSIITEYVRPEIREKVGLDEIAVILISVYQSVLTDIILQQQVDRDHWKFVLRQMLTQGLMKED